MKKPITKGAISAMVIGILSIPFAFFYAIPGLVLSIIGMSKSKKTRDIFDENPDVYKPSSESFIKTAKICSIIGLILSIVMLIVFALFFVFLFAAADQAGFSFEMLMDEIL